MKLSGGLKQRLIAVSVALQQQYNRLPITIGDEPTASLDAISEELITKVFDELSSDSQTVITVAHRLGTIRHANKVVVMQDWRKDNTGNMSSIEGVYASVQDAYEHSKLFQELADTQGFNPYAASLPLNGQEKKVVLKTK